MQTYKQGYKAGEKGAWFGIISNLLLFVVKIFAGIFGRSQAMVADAFHTGSDALTSIGVLIGFKIARKPADDHHPLGHGKTESFVASIIAMVLIALGVGIVVHTGRILITGNFKTPESIALVVALVSIVVKEFTFKRVLKTSNEIGSASLKADAYHHRSDVISSVAAFIGILGARLGYAIMDPLASIVVAAFILKMGADTFHLAYDELLDAAPPDEFYDHIREIVESVDCVAQIKDVCVRKAGIEQFLEVTIGVRGEMTVDDSHMVTVKIQDALFEKVPSVKDVVIHVEPVGDKD